MTNLVARADSLPNSETLNGLWKLADNLGQTEFVPRSLRGNTAAIMASMLFGRELGIGPMQALQSIQVIEGKPTASPELMRALILRAGHSFTVEVSGTQATATGKRVDTGDEGSATFTLQDAADAGLCQIKDGKAFARSQKGNRLPWESYTEDMLVARATSRLARRLFSDVISGVSYVPEEMSSVAEGPMTVTISPEPPGPAEVVTFEPPSLAGSTIEAGALLDYGDVTITNATLDEEGPGAPLADLETGEIIDTSADVVRPPPNVADDPQPDDQGSLLDRLTSLVQAVQPETSRNELRGKLYAAFGPPTHMSPTQILAAIKVAQDWPASSSGLAGEIPDEPF